MGKPDGLDRLVQCLIALAAFVTFANGPVMLVAPLYWYGLIPTARFTGPSIFLHQRSQRIRSQMKISEGLRSTDRGIPATTCVSTTART